MTTVPPHRRYELLVERHLSPATLATFPLALTTTAVPRHRVRRLLVPADRDLAEVVAWLTRRSIAVLEIRRRPAAPAVPAGPDRGGAAGGAAGLVVLPVQPPGGTPDPAPAQGHAAGTMPCAPARRRLGVVGTSPERKDEGP